MSRVLWLLFGVPRRSRPFSFCVFFVYFVELGYVILCNVTLGFRLMSSRVVLRRVVLCYVAPIYYFV